MFLIFDISDILGAIKLKKWLYVMDTRYKSKAILYLIYNIFQIFQIVYEGNAML